MGSPVNGCGLSRLRLAGRVSDLGKSHSDEFRTSCLDWNLWWPNVAVRGVVTGWPYGRSIRELMIDG